MYAAPRGNEAEMQKVIAQAMESAEVQDALKQVLIQGSIQDEDDSPADLVSLQSVLAANMEHNDGDDENIKAQLMKFMADIQTSGSSAHAQWKWWKKHRVGHKVWRGVKRLIGW